MDEYSWAEILYCLFLNFSVFIENKFLKKNRRMIMKKKENVVKKVKIVKSEYANE